MGTPLSACRIVENEPFAAQNEQDQRSNMPTMLTTCSWWFVVVNLYSGTIDPDSLGVSWPWYPKIPKRIATVPVKSQTSPVWTRPHLWSSFPLWLIKSLAVRETFGDLGCPQTPCYKLDFWWVK